MNDNFEFPARPYFVSNIQDYFECMSKNRETLTDNSHVKKCISKIGKKKFIKN